MAQLPNTITPAADRLGALPVEEGGEPQRRKRSWSWKGLQRLPPPFYIMHTRFLTLPTG